ncbi:MAG: DUF3240 family protein [Hyphomicrobiaceae bacterium]
MDQPLCKLTLVYPIAAEERLLEIAMAARHPIGGFTTWRVEGHGQDFSRASVAERVRGRVTRGMFVLVQTRALIDQLLADLEAQAPVEHLTYWVEPVLAFGRMKVRETHGDTAHQAE